MASRFIPTKTNPLDGGYYQVSTVEPFALQFQMGVFGDIKVVAQQLASPDRFGDQSNWLFYHETALTGIYYRTQAVARHYFELHAWIPVPRNPFDVEYHLASILFGMDSAIECCTFALNAVGSAIAPAEFRSLEDPKALRDVSPLDITTAVAKRPSPPGYTKVFPSVVELWQGRKELIRLITDNHDVSKHRTSSFTGGQYRTDPPPGFFESLGVEGDGSAQFVYTPIAETLLRRDPKKHRPKGHSTPLEECVHLEQIAPEFVTFINETGARALGDLQRYV